VAVPVHVVVLQLLAVTHGRQTGVAVAGALWPASPGAPTVPAAGR
jgi:hypothetical protein